MFETLTFLSFAFIAFSTLLYLAILHTPNETKATLIMLVVLNFPIYLSDYHYFLSLVELFLYYNILQYDLCNIVMRFKFECFLPILHNI